MTRLVVLILVGLGLLRALSTYLASYPTLDRCSPSPFRMQATTVLSQSCFFESVGICKPLNS